MAYRLAVYRGKLSGLHDFMSRYIKGYNGRKAWLENRGVKNGRSGASKAGNESYIYKSAKGHLESVESNHD